MAFAINTTKPLPTMPTFKRRARKRRDHPDTMTTSSQPSVLAPDPVDARTTNQMGLLEAVSEPGREQPVQFAAQCTPTLKQGSAPGLQRSTAAGEHQSPGRSADESDRRFAYNEYGPPALGQSGEGQGTTAEQVEDLTRTDSPSTRSNAPAMPVELTLRLSLRERRPKIQLTIPRTKSKTYAAIPHDDHPGQRRPASRGATKGVSPPSTTSRSRGDAGNSPTKLSVVSPLSTMEMPQPRRPFTTFSFEGLTDDPANRETLLSKSTFSSSSEDAGEHDDQSSCYSSHSSISSFASDPTAAKLVVPNAELPVVSPTAAGGFDAGRSASKSPAPSQVMRSLPCRNDGANRNKPLPPAPGPDEVKSLNYSAHPFGRTSSTTAGRKNRGLLPLSRQSTMSVSSRVSLRSKYTPTDFEPGDNALQRSSSKNLAPASPADPVSPTLSQAELELEAHLCAIDEYGPVDGPEVPLVDDPLQIRRGPMHMQPSRKPPSPQPSQVTAERLLPDGKAHPAKAATHVAMQMRPGKDSDRTLGTRVSAPAVGSKDKANRVLGRSGQATTTGRQPSAGPPGEPSESPHSGRNISMDDAETPVTDRSPLISDAAFEEVRQRLEFLSPKSDALQDFLEFHQQNFPDAGVTPPPRQEASTGTRSIDSSCRPTEPSKSPRRAPPPHLPTRPHPFTPAGRTPRAGPRARRDPRPRPGRSQTTSDVPTGDVPVPSPGTSVQQSRAGEDEERMISAAAAEQVLLCVLENLDHLQDLFAAATVSRGFYRTFKRHELRLMKNALYRMSPAAWELREMSPPVPAGEGAGPGSTSAYTPSLYLQSYMKDMYTMVALKSMILVHCESFLRVDTITALAGAETVRASQIDDAFWRVWTFCRLFGCGTKREDDIVGQMDWLRGGVQARQQARSMRPRDQSSEGDGNDTSFNRGPAFGQGNHGGLGAEELYDMTEIWTCLGVLVGGFQGKRELAREFGVFDNANIPVDNVEKEDAALEEWTHHLLTLAPPAILDVTSATSPTATTFAHAHSRGYTSWSPPPTGISRSTFLKEAVSRVYHEKMLERHPAVKSPSRESSLSATPERTIAASRQRIAAHGAEIRAKRKDPAFQALPPSDERPMSYFPDVLRILEHLPGVTDDSSSTTTLSSLAPSSQIVPTGSGVTTPTTTVNLMHSPSSCFSIRHQETIVAKDLYLGPQVRDPVDIALERLLQMGFDRKTATKALAETDTGNSIDFDKALETLVRQRKRVVSHVASSNYGSFSNPAVPTVPARRASPKRFVGLGIGGSDRYA